MVLATADDYRAHHPTTAKLVIEVAIASEELDREKIDLYAESGVAEYWLVLAKKACVEQYSAPSSGKYNRCQTLSFEAAIVCGALPTIRVDLPQLK